MRTMPWMVLSVFAAAAVPVLAQDDTPEIAIEEAAVEQAADTMPSLEEIAATNPAIEIRGGEDGDADAMMMLSDLLFGFGEDTLTPEAENVLASVSADLASVPAMRITGHTDGIGSEEDNRALGQRRADAVRDWLVANTDLTADVIYPVGVGEADPIAENVTDDGEDSPDGRAQNRRVEFILLQANGFPLR